MKKRLKNGLIIGILLIVLMMLVLTIGILVYAYIVIPMKHEDIVSEATPKTYQTEILDADGTVIQKLSGEASNRVYVELDQIPDNLEHAFIAIEDERFYRHHGVDVKAILRSAFVGIKNRDFSQGGSTITQQLVKNNILTSWTEEKTFADKAKRKADEICLALQLETKVSKEQILQNYLNTINLGGGCWGVETASRYYFGKSAADLNLSECAVLAGITQNPTGYNPILNPENNKERRDQVLANMLDQGYISQSEYEDAVADPVFERIAESEHHSDKDDIMSYFEDALVMTLINDLKEQCGYTDEQASAMIYQGGLTVYSTVDSDLQKICENAVNNDGLYSSEAQSSAVLIDQETGAVKALVGGRGEKTADLIFNRATDSERQIGSVMKIIGEYAAAIDDGKLTLGSVLEDSPYSYADGTPVYNWDYKFQGHITVKDAIIASNNIAALRAMDLVGIDGVLESLKSFGITTLDDSDAIETLALGGTSNGLTNLEVTAAYAALANGGVYQKPVFYTKVTDHKGNVLLKTEQESHRSVSKETAALLTDAMKAVVTEGTGNGCAIDNMEVAGKSGTTNGSVDAWFVGFSPYLTLGVWGGFDENQEQADTMYVKNIWHQVMADAHTGLDYKSLSVPDDFVTKNICSKCGKLALSRTCNQTVQGDMTENQIYVPGTAPTAYCDCHETVTLCKETGMKANIYCPGYFTKTEVYLTTAIPGTEEEAYGLNRELASQNCTKHTSLWDRMFGGSDEKDDEKKQDENHNQNDGWDHFDTDENQDQQEQQPDYDRNDDYNQEDDSGDVWNGLRDYWNTWFN